MIEEREFLVAAGRAAHALLREDNDEAVVQARMLSEFSQVDVTLVQADGRHQKVKPSFDLIDALEGHRNASYRDGKGAWYSATVNVTAEGSMDAKFDYDNEPAWTRDIPSHLYVSDTNKYPRDPDVTPDWLARRLEEGRANPA